MKEQLSNAIKESKLPSYVYGYPSKRSYRSFDEAISKKNIWMNSKGNLNIYIHIPFCRYKCSYCTLLSIGACESSLRKDYINKLIEEIEYCGKFLKGKKVDSIYFGGGTPTVLEKDEFKTIFECLNKYFYNLSKNAEISVETSPDTAKEDLLMYLKSLGVNRVSIGVQSFKKEELKSINRPTSVNMIENALNTITKCGFKNFNLDLIYGLEGQSKSDFLLNLERALTFKPTSINLYPIVIRETTEIYKDKLRNKDGFVKNEDKYSIYEANVKFLKENGYRQETFVSFTNLDTDGYVQQFSDFKGNGLLGFGVGSRSYTGEVHYSSNYSEDDNSIVSIIKEYIESDITKPVEYGFILNLDEQKRRYTALNLIVNRLSINKYQDKFNSDIFIDFKEEIDALLIEECIKIIDDKINLTDKGYKYSSLIGNLFHSIESKRLVEEFIQLSKKDQSMA